MQLHHKNWKSKYALELRKLPTNFQNNHNPKQLSNNDEDSSMFQLPLKEINAHLKLEDDGEEVKKEQLAEASWEIENKEPKKVENKKIERKDSFFNPRPIVYVKTNMSLDLKKKNKVQNKKKQGSKIMLFLAFILLVVATLVVFAIFAIALAYGGLNWISILLLIATIGILALTVFTYLKFLEQ